MCSWPARHSRASSRTSLSFLGADFSFESSSRACLSYGLPEKQTWKHMLFASVSRVARSVFEHAFSSSQRLAFCISFYMMFLSMVTPRSPTFFS